MRTKIWIENPALNHNFRLRALIANCLLRSRIWLHAMFLILLSAIAFFANFGCDKSRWFFLFCPQKRRAGKLSSLKKIVTFLGACQDKCAEKSLFRTAGGQNVTKIPWLGPPPLEVWSAHFQGKVEMKYIPIFGRGSENVIRFSLWSLFVTKNVLCGFSAFMHKTVKKNTFTTVDPSKTNRSEK